jgi:hypothetical protein
VPAAPTSLLEIADRVDARLRQLVDVEERRRSALT